ASLKIQFLRMNSLSFHCPCSGMTPGVQPDSIEAWGRQFTEGNFTLTQELALLVGCNHPYTAIKLCFYPLPVGLTAKVAAFLTQLTQVRKMVMNAFWLPLYKLALLNNTAIKSGHPIVAFWLTVIKISNNPMA